jgi:hypothetical protein
MLEYLEITTKVGCPIGCLKYCPQDVLVKNYVSPERVLNLKNFEKAVSTVPRSVEICFSGFCEPFANPDAVRMVEHAYARGHPVSVFTTLYNLSLGDVDALVKVPFEKFCLHLPDGKYAHIPVSPAYMLNVFTVLQNVRNVGFSCMNGLFASNQREDFVRGRNLKRHPIGYCYKRRYPEFVLMPNGDVQLCCMDFGLKHKVGNLLHEDYSAIRKRFLNGSKKYALCSYCNYDSGRFLLKRIAYATRLINLEKMLRSFGGS